MNTALNNLSSGLLGGNVKGDISINVQFDPSTSFLLAVFLFIAIVGAQLFIKMVR